MQEGLAVVTQLRWKRLTLGYKSPRHMFVAGSKAVLNYEAESHEGSAMLEGARITSLRRFTDPSGSQYQPDIQLTFPHT
jgi:hypothetical protein